MLAGDIDDRLAALQHQRAVEALQGRTQQDDLALRLREARTWCAARFDARDVPRCLRPRWLTPRPFTYEQSAAERWYAVDDVVARRREDLVRQRMALRDDLAGRLMVYYLDADLCDGAAAAESHDVLDLHNAPPAGTWVGYFDDGDARDISYRAYLVAWIPQPLVALVDGGIAVNPEECIAWLGDTDLAVRALLGG